MGQITSIDWPCPAGPCEAESSRRRAQLAFLSRCLRNHAGQWGSLLHAGFPTDMMFIRSFRIEGSFRGMCRSAFRQVNVWKEAAYVNGKRLCGICIPHPRKSITSVREIFLSSSSRADSDCALRSCVGTRVVKSTNGSGLEKQPLSARSSSFGKRLDPALKSWLDNVILPALVREYLAEIKMWNRLATTGPSELTSDKDGNKS
jgi:hypothetical protein